jgi:hypothetical protein
MYGRGADPAEELRAFVPLCGHGRLRASQRRASGGMRQASAVEDVSEKGDAGGYGEDGCQ